MTKEYVINACSGQGIEVKAGQQITIIDMEGGQVVDFFAECKNKPNEFLSAGVTIDCTLSLQETTRSESIKFASCCVAFAPSTPGTCRSSALHDADFMLSDSGDLKRRVFLHFQGRRRKRTGSTLIEDNAENEEIIPF